jgi:transketolase
LETAAATWASAAAKGPVYLRLGKAGEPNLTADAVEPFVFGKLRYLRRGNDMCVLSYGPIMKMALQVADGLEASGRSVSVVSAHTLKPLDRAGLEQIMRNHAEVIVIEEHSSNGGLAAQTKQLAWDISASCRLSTFTLQDQFIHTFGTHADVLAAHGLEPERILSAIGAGQRADRSTLVGTSATA